MKSLIIILLLLLSTYFNLSAQDREIINIGTSPISPNKDNSTTAYQKINNNFSYIWNVLDTIQYNIIVDSLHIGITSNIVLTTNGTSGPATQSGDTINIPNYQISGSGNIDTTMSVWAGLYTGTQTEKFIKALKIAEATNRKLIVNDTITLVGNAGFNLTNYGVRIEGAGKIKAATGTDIVLQFSSVRSSAVTISSDIVTGARTIILSDADATIQTGDILQIVSTVLWGSSGVGSDYYKGEVVKVQSVSGATITLTDMVHMSFATATTTIRKMNSKPVSIIGVSFENVSVETWYCRDVVVADCHWINHLECLQINLAYNETVINNTANKTSGSFNYGFTSYSCVNTYIVNNPDISYFDQSIICGAANGCGPCINYNVIGNKCSVFSTIGGVVDTHAPCIGINVSDNIVNTLGIAFFLKGIDINCNNNTINLIGNTSRGIHLEREYTSVVATGLYNKNNYINCSNNKIFGVTIADGGTGINYVFAHVGDSSKSTIFENNQIGIYGTPLSISDDGGTLNYLKTLKMIGNVFESYSSYAFYLSSSCFINDIISIGNTYTGNYKDSYSVFVSTSARYKNISFFKDKVSCSTGIDDFSKCVIVNGYLGTNASFKECNFLNGSTTFNGVTNATYSDNSISNAKYGFVSMVSVVNPRVERNELDSCTGISPLQYEKFIHKIDTTPATSGTMTLEVINSRHILTTMYTITPSGDCTFNVQDNDLNYIEGEVGQTLDFIVTATSTSRTLTFGSHFKSLGTLSTGTDPTKKFHVTFTFDGTDFVEYHRPVAL